MSHSDSDSAVRTHRTRRTIEASPAAVFTAIRDPDRLTRWWGPEGFSSTFHEFAFEAGGLWRLILHGPHGTDYPNRNRFLEVIPDSRVVVEHLSEEHHFILTISLTGTGANTEVEWVQEFDTAEHFRQVESVVAPANEQNLERLAAEVARAG